MLDFAVCPLPYRHVIPFAMSFAVPFSIPFFGIFRYHISPYHFVYIFICVFFMPFFMSFSMPLSLISVLCKWLLLAPIWLYRWCISPFTPPACRFQPVCSAYAIEAIRRHGAWFGFWLAVKRLSRCHAWEKLGGKQGFDPVPIAVLPVTWYAVWRIKGHEGENKQKAQNKQDA